MKPEDKQKNSAKSLQLCAILCDLVDCSPPGSSVHVDSPGKNNEVGCQPSSRGPSQPSAVCGTSTAKD
ncbi:hypothetical protein CapIbe_014342 [Capra ibex]